MDPPSAFHASPSVYYSIWVVCLRAGVSVRVPLCSSSCVAAPERAYSSPLCMLTFFHSKRSCARPMEPLWSLICELLHYSARCSPAPRQARSAYATRALCLSLVGCVSRCGRRRATHLRKNKYITMLYGRHLETTRQDEGLASRYKYNYVSERV